MFARDDVHRGRRFPLLWVFVPLVAGASIVTGLAVLAQASLGFPDAGLAERIDAAAAEGDPMLAEVTDFEWDRVCVVPPRVSEEEVDELLGFDWGVVGGDRFANRLLLVFVRDGEVVSHLFLERTVVSRPRAPGECRTPDDEATRL
ncbi:MAG TPA: hypothetical protein VM253_08320 [Candidatus Limnocylindrales bacterium]|jgi:hypothetical protein|nr:hypothetical protein [Candidatus Limnocylindrales bacterium]